MVTTSKSDSSLYKIISKELNRTEGEILLIDDLEENIIAAQKAGLKTILYTNNLGLFRQIERLLV